MSPTRREFLRSCLLSSSLLAMGCDEKFFPKKLPGTFHSPSLQFGHLIRKGVFPSISSEERIEVAIIGGGIAGLSAANRLLRKGKTNFRVYELESQFGGNSRSGENRITAYPWGAHYLPVPNEESEYVREFCEEHGISQGKDTENRPLYREEFLCHELEERLFVHGKFQNGIIPTIGVNETERGQYKAFFELMESYRQAKGRDGKFAFAIPMELSSQDPEFLNLDSQSFASFLDGKGLTAPPLRWYTNYCCRDDYGTTEQDTSAWAGIHYFAGRRAFGGNIKGEQLLTWPEGNGFLVKKLMGKIQPYLQKDRLIYSIEKKEDRVLLSALDTQTEKTLRIEAKAIIYAAPRFTFPYICKQETSTRSAYKDTLHYAPWVVGNISVENSPDVKSLAWDNVSYHSESLGFVVSTHQKLEQDIGQSVLSWYMPLSRSTPAEERKAALERSLEDWQRLIQSDLQKTHKELLPHITAIDVCVWGHAMIRPEPGFLWGKARRALLEPEGRIFFAHSDMSGLSLFEEAQYRGIVAADDLLRLLES